MPLYLNEVTNYRNYKYAIEVVSTETSWLGRIDLFTEIRKWLSENQIPNREHSTDAAWYFETRRDAMLFMLRWSDNV